MSKEHYLKSSCNRLVSASAIKVLMIAAMALYSSVSIPNLRILARMPIQDQQITMGGRLRRWLNRPMAAATEAAMKPEPLTHQDKFEVTSLLCASNNLIIAALVGVLVFQGAQAYAQRQFEKEMRQRASAVKTQKAQ